jgi:ElaB/YqjD/DUF883 family membrane-anchored ribosome-binding protein
MVVSMNREDIIRMAREAGFDTDLPTFQDGTAIALKLAALVASAERERIKQANAPEIERINAHIKELEDAVIAEREACAKIADELVGQDLEHNFSALIAHNIRARG